MAKEDLYELIDPQSPESVERDVVDVMTSFDPEFEVERLRDLYRDVVRLFQGRYSGYRASDAWYHDLEHTNTVFLCVAAMLYGAHQEGVAIDARGRLVVLACALFHDVGLIRREWEDGEGTGARFTVGHEERSIAFMEDYFLLHGYSEKDVADARQIILCTALERSLGQIPFRDDQVRLLGQVLGSADLIAQMADRAYLEKLLLLYREFKEGGVAGYRSELELLEKTPAFYHTVVKRRLDEEFQGVHTFLDTHAHTRWGLNHDPFHKSIQRNLDYLDRILSQDKSHYRDWLRRGGIADSLFTEG